jgi:hypothetical protein
MLETLNCAVEGPNRTLFEVAVDVARETFPQNLGAALKVAAKTSFTDINLVPRRREGDQGDANDERDDEPGAE